MSVTEQPQTYTQRAAGAIAEADAMIIGELAQFVGAPEDDAPAPAAAPKTDPAPREEATPRPTPKDAPPLDQATRSDSPGDDDEPVTLTRKELAAHLDDKTKRERSAQAAMTERARAAEEKLAALQKERDEIFSHNQALFKVRNEAKAAQREGRAFDVDDATDQAFAEQQAIAGQRAAEERARQAEVAQQNQVWTQESNRRTQEATIGYERAQRQIVQLANEHGVTVTADEITGWIRDAYQDPIVARDIKRWMDPRTRGDEANDSIAATYERVSEKATAQIAARAAQKATAGKPEPRVFDRRTVGGEIGGSVATQQNLTPRQRQAQALADADEQAERDMQKLLAS